MGRARNQAPRPALPLHPAWWAPLAAALVALDVLVLGLPVPGLLASVALCVVHGARLVLAMLRRQRRRLLRLALSMATFTLAVAACLVLTGLDRQLGAERAGELARALERHRAEQGAWPERLEQLVPRYLPAVPRAGFRLCFAEFEYQPDPPELSWTVWPPSGRRVLELDDGQARALR
ncbi:MAG TPA: hypothetical protein PK668_18665 [Myxococcota bacterium]|nr:hypothetical protein [Myxococcota bacterium]HRY96575.1 hypothetical protein [Myxococcota bacterium]HSA22840.1 hypothetical protein [Myxococcota bacterium]